MSERIHNELCLGTTVSIYSAQFPGLVCSYSHIVRRKTKLNKLCRLLRLRQFKKQMKDHSQKSLIINLSCFMLHSIIENYFRMVPRHMSIITQTLLVESNRLGSGVLSFSLQYSIIAFSSRSIYFDFFINVHLFMFTIQFAILLE